MNLYLDSSALAKRYLLEHGSDIVADFCARANRIDVSVICYPELVSAFNRLKREKRLTTALCNKLRKRLEEDLFSANLTPLEPLLIDASIRCIERCGIKTLDALHVGTALYLRSDLFLTADRTQQRAATQMKLKSHFVG